MPASDGLAEPVPRPTEDPDATLKPPQFTLRALLVGTALAAGLLSVLLALGWFWSVALLFLMVLVGGHVLGNSLGTKLRDKAPARPTARGPARSAHRTHHAHVTLPTRLRERARLHWINLVLTVLSAAAGSYFGGAALALNYPEATTAAIVVGYVSSGVLGGFAGFVVSSFVAVVRQALAEAHAGSDRRPPRTSPPASSSTVDRN